jgi:hypothetical protein
MNGLKDTFLQNHNLFLVSEFAQAPPSAFIRELNPTTNV